MTKRNKLLSVVMALLLMACTVLSVGAYTYAPETATSGSIVITTTASETTVQPGDTVTFNITIDPGTQSDKFYDFVGSGTLILFNRDQLTPVGSTILEFRTYEGQHLATYANPNSPAGNMDMPMTALTRFLTAEEQEYLTRAIMVSNSSTSTANRWNPVPGESMMSFKMTVSEDVQPGEEIWVGLHECGFEGGQSFFSYYGANTRILRPALTDYNLTNSMVKLTVAGAEAEGPAVAKSRSQVKMTATSDTTVADAFTFRVISTITDADWDAYFANTAAGGDTSAIQRLGFVAYKGTDGFDMETAKAVAQGTATEGYDVAWTDYVQKADDSSDAYFGARLEITGADTRCDVTYVGVVEYLNADGTTAYAFYDAAEQALLNTNYDTIVADYLARYPYGA